MSSGYSFNAARYWVDCWRLLYGSRPLVFFSIFIFWAASRFCSGNCFFCTPPFYARKSCLFEEKIRKFPDSEFTVSPIIATLITTSGEIVFIALAVMSLPAMLLTWMAGDLAFMILPIGFGDSFLAGVSLFLSFWITGFLSYLLARWIREWTMAIFSIAQNVDLIQHGNVSCHPQEGKES